MMLVVVDGDAEVETKYDPLVYRLLAAAHGWPPVLVDALDDAALDEAIASIVQHA